MNVSEGPHLLEVGGKGEHMVAGPALPAHSDCPPSPHTQQCPCCEGTGTTPGQREAAEKAAVVSRGARAEAPARGSPGLKDPVPGARKPSPAPRTGSGAPASGLPADRRVPTGSFGNEREAAVCRGAEGGGFMTSSVGRALWGAQCSSCHCRVGEGDKGTSTALGPSR